MSAVLPGELDVPSGDGGDGEEGMGAAAADAVANLSAGPAGDTPSGGQQVVAKLLISNAAAGSVIGKVRRFAAEGRYGLSGSFDSVCACMSRARVCDAPRCGRGDPSADAPARP